MVRFLQTFKSICNIKVPNLILINLSFYECVYQHLGATVFPDFSAGKTYVYKYEMSVINGLPEEGLARAKMNASCKFLISAFDKNTYMLKVNS